MTSLEVKSWKKYSRLLDFKFGYVRFNKLNFTMLLSAMEPYLKAALQISEEDKTKKRSKKSDEEEEVVEDSVKMLLNPMLKLVKSKILDESYEGSVFEPAVGGAKIREVNAARYHAGLTNADFPSDLSALKHPARLFEQNVSVY